MKKLISLIIAITMACGIIIPVKFDARAMVELTVNAKGDGTSSYRTIQEALDQAEANSVIKVYPGIYVVPFNVTASNEIDTDKTGISFVGVDASGDNVTGAPLATVIYDDAYVNPVQSAVTFSGLTLEKYSDSATLEAAPSVPGTYATLNAAVADLPEHSLLKVSGPVTQATTLDIDKALTIVGVNSGKINLSTAASQINVKAENVRFCHLTMSCTATAAGPTGSFFEVTRPGFSMMKVSLIGTSTKITSYVQIYGNGIRTDRCDFSKLLANIPGISSNAKCQIDLKDTVFTQDTISSTGIVSTGTDSSLILNRCSFNISKTLITGVNISNAKDITVKNNTLFDYTVNSSTGTSMIINNVDTLLFKDSTFKNLSNKKAVSHIVTSNNETVTVDNCTFNAEGAGVAGGNNHCIELDTAASFTMTDSNLLTKGNYNTGISIKNVPVVLLKDSTISADTGTYCNGVLIDTAATSVTVNECVFDYKAPGSLAADVNTCLGVSNSPVFSMINASVIKTTGAYIKGLNLDKVATINLTGSTHEIMSGAASRAVVINDADTINFTASSKMICSATATASNLNKGFEITKANTFNFTNSILSIPGTYTYGIDTTDVKTVNINGVADTTVFDIIGAGNRGANINGSATVAPEVNVNDANIAIASGTSYGIATTGAANVEVDNSDITITHKDSNKTCYGISADTKKFSFTNGDIDVTMAASIGIEVKNAEQETGNSIIFDSINLHIAQNKNIYGLRTNSSKGVTFANVKAVVEETATYANAIALSDTSDVNIITGNTFDVRSLQSACISSSSTVPNPKYVPYEISKDFLGHNIRIKTTDFKLDGGATGISAPTNNNLTITNNTFTCENALTAISFGYGTGHLIKNNTIISNGKTDRGIISDGMNDQDPWVDDEYTLHPELRSVIEQNYMSGNYDNIIYSANNGDLITKHDFTNCTATTQVMVNICKDVDITENLFSAAREVGAPCIRAYNSTIGNVSTNVFQFVGDATEVLAVEGTLKMITGRQDSKNGNTLLPNEKFRDDVVTHIGNTINHKVPVETEVEALTDDTLYKYILHFPRSSVTLKAEKLVTGGVLGNNKFDFVVKDGDGKVVAEAQNDLSGKITFPAITFDNTGTYAFTVSEATDDFGKWITDKTMHTVTVVITRDTLNNLVSNVQYPAGSVKFTNTYTPDPVSVVLEATKKVEGGTLGNNKFDFVVLDEDNKPVAQAKNGTDGKIIFPAISFTKPGVYHYKIDEINENSANWKMDPTIFDVAITVTQDSDNILRYSVNYPKAAEFKNVYTPTAVGVTLEATKKAVNGNLVDGQFNFAVMDGSTVVTTGTNTATGEIKFKPISYNAIGTHNYTVVETSKSSGNWTTDSIVFNVSVTIKQKANNALSFEINYPTGGVVFTNTYTPPVEPPKAGTATLHISKKLVDENNEIIGTGKKFAVRLYDAEKNLVSRVVLSANTDEVVLNNIVSDKTYYMVEEDGTFTIDGYDVIDVGETTSKVLGFHVPKVAEGATQDIWIRVNNSVMPEQLLTIPDDDVPLTPYTPPNFDVPVINVPLTDAPSPQTGDQFPHLTWVVFASSALMLTFIQKKTKHKT